jgi:hypothetical protein
LLHAHDLLDVIDVLDQHVQIGASLLVLLLEMLREPGEESRNALPLRRRAEKDRQVVLMLREQLHDLAQMRETRGLEPLADARHAEVDAVEDVLPTF